MAAAHKKILLVFSALGLALVLLVVASLAWLSLQNVDLRALSRTLLPPAAKAERFRDWQQTPFLARLRFALDYETSAADEATYARHLESVTPAALLDFVEMRHPFCHGAAHDLGAAILAKTQDVAKALDACDTRCTNGCMHGVLGQFFARPATAQASDGAPALAPDALCTREAVTKRYKPGNCAHAVGHALMKLSAANPDKALANCARFTDPGMEYYCATGVFMSYEERWGNEGEPRAAAGFPCAPDTKFPAACYRYFLPHLTEDDKPSGEQLLAHCLSLPDRRQMGCFHGLGAYFLNTIADTPGALHRICEKGSEADRALCIEGAVEKLSDHDPGLAERACRSIEGKDQEVCLAAAHDGMYRLEKPTMKYYLP